MHDRKGEVSAWIPVALSSDLPKGGVLRTFVNGRDLAVWRSRSGVVRAWDNRCPHRGMRLSFGFVRGESLTCIYHGWQYGIDGVCRYIPAHPDLSPPATLCTTAFAAVEERGLIWTSLTDDQDAPGVAIADAEPLRSLVVNRDMAAVRSMFAEARFPITDAWTPSEGGFLTVDEGDGLMIREGVLEEVSRRLIAALQPLPGDRTAMHVLTSPSASPSLKKSLSRWLERLRWFAENSDVETRSWRPAEALGRV